MLPQLLDGGSVAAILVAAERMAVWSVRLLPRATRQHRYHPVGNPPDREHDERLIMTDTADPAESPSQADPYAGARQMGIPVPAPADPQADAEAPQRTGDDSVDYAAYIAWRDSQKPAAGLAPRAAVTVPPDTATTVGSYLGADVTAVENTVQAVAPGLVSRLRTIISDHQSLIDELTQVVGEVEKM